MVGKEREETTSSSFRSSRSGTDGKGIFCTRSPFISADLVARFHVHSLAPVTWVRVAGQRELPNRRTKWGDKNDCSLLFSTPLSAVLYYGAPANFQCNKLAEREKGEPEQKMPLSPS